MNALTANEIWKLIERSKNVENVIISKWIFKVKYIFTKKIDRYKARLVVRSFNQMQNIDYDEIFSSTLRLKLLQMLLAFAAHFDYEIKQMSVSNAYFKKILKKDIYMKIFKNYVISNDSANNQSNKKTKNRILRLLRLFYEFKQFDWKWNFKAKNHLKIINFQSINSDDCVFFDKSKRIILILYVDDLLIFFQSVENINTMKKKLFQKFRMKNMKRIIFILNIRIKRNTDKKFIAIYQIIYIKIFFHEYEIKDAHLMIIFIDDYLLLTLSDTTEARIDQRKYQKKSVISCTQWLLFVQI